MNILQIGDVLLETNKNVRYRVISIHQEDVILCELDTDKLVLEDFNLNIILELIAQNQVKVEHPEVTIFDITMLSEENRKNFLNKKAAMQKLTKAYGPTFLELATKKPKPEVKKIMEEHNLKMTAFWATCRKYLQSGMQDVSLVDQKAFGNSKGKEYEYTAKPGKHSEYTKNAGVVITDTIKSYFQEALLDCIRRSPAAAGAVVNGSSAVTAAAV